MSSLVNTQFSPLTWIPSILETANNAENIINEMLDMISDYQDQESSLNGKGKNVRGSIDRTFKSNQALCRREQIFGEVNDSDVVATRVDVVLKSDSSKYCILSVLKRHFLFSQLNDNELEDVIDSMQSFTAFENTKIITEGETGDVFYVLETGTCDISIQGQVIQSIRDGSSFGDLALMYNCPRKATVVTTSDCYFWTLDRLFFRRAMVASSSHQTAQLAQFLSKITLFENLTEQTLNQLARSLSKRTFQPGEYIIRQGEIGDRLYVIGRGTVRVTINGENSDQETLLSKLSEGEIFGERALIKKEPRKANCIAETICECYFLNNQDFASMLGEIVDKLNDLDEFRLLRSLPVFSKLSVSRLLALKKSMVMLDLSYGQRVVCNRKFVYVVLIGAIESSDGKKHGPRGVIGDTESDIENIALTSMTRESKIAYISKDILNQNLDDQANSTSTDDLSNSRKVELEIGQSIKDDSLESHADYQIFSERRNRQMKRHREYNVNRSKIENLKIFQVLGKGTFGMVYLARNSVNDGYVALKCLDKEALVKSAQYHYVQREMLAMQCLSHPFIGEYYGVALSPRKIMFEIEYISGGDLWTYIYEINNVNADKVIGLSSQTTALYSAMISMALKHIHHLGYCYRDLKPENILISDQGYLKLVDFGFAKTVPFINKSDRIQYRTFTFCGTAEYMAPEIVLTQGHDKTVDCWAFGILLYELMCAYTPFEGRNQQRTFEKIVHSQKHLLFPQNFDPHAKSLIRRLLHPNPALRLGALQNGFDELRTQAFYVTQSVNFDQLLNREVVMAYIPRQKPFDSSSSKDLLNLDEEFKAVVKDDYSSIFGSLLKNTDELS